MSPEASFHLSFLTLVRLACKTFSEVFSVSVILRRDGVDNNDDNGDNDDNDDIGNNNNYDDDR